VHVAAGTYSTDSSADESAGDAKMADDEEAVGIEKEATDHAENAPSAHLEA
jgi:hypothetical protein